MAKLDVKAYARGLIEAAIILFGTPVISGVLAPLPVLSNLAGIGLGEISVLALLVAGGLVVGSEVVISKVKALK